MNRKSFLQLSASALLGLGLWPGCVRARNNGRGGAFRFVALNDAHFQSEQCGPWFEKAAASIRSLEPHPELCLMLGDLSEHGTSAELGPMKEVLGSLHIPVHTVIGNHDYEPDNRRTSWDGLFPGSLNYHFRYRGWQFVGLDSTEGTKWEKTRIQPQTLEWVDAHLTSWDRHAPTVLFTHFPLGHQVPMRPENADDLLERFTELNLVAVFNGHFHGFTERKRGQTILTTNRCCAISRGNHDGTTEKGYFICDAREGRVERTFMELKPVV